MEYEVRDIMFIRRPESVADQDKLAKVMAEMPMAYLPPDEFGHEVCVCENCATELAKGDVEAFNKERGFDWCGKNITGDDLEEGPQPFYVIFAADLTINQVDAIREVAEMEGITDLKIDEWEEDGYSGEACIYPCDKCEKPCITIDINQIVGDLP